MHDKAFLEELLRNRLYMNTTYTILFSSILMILLSGFGWFAAMKEIKCFLLTYFVLLFLLSIITMIGGVLAYVFREQVFPEIVYKPSQLLVSILKGCVDHESGDGDRGAKLSARPAKGTSDKARSQSEALT